MGDVAMLKISDIKTLILTGWFVHASVLMSGLPLEHIVITFCVPGPQVDVHCFLTALQPLPTPDPLSVPAHFCQG